MRQQILLLVMLAITAPARADEAPMLRPVRDVAVEYRSSDVQAGPGADPGAAVTMRFSSKTGRIRIDGRSGRGYVILDPASGLMTTVLEQRHIYAERPADPGMLAMFRAGNAAFRKTGSDTVAGVACTTYDATFNDHSGQVCLTGDGVMLRARGAEPDRERELEAVSVSYAAQADSLFEVPAEFQKLDMAAPPQGANPGPAGPPDEMPRSPAPGPGNGH